MCSSRALKLPQPTLSLAHRVEFTPVRRETAFVLTRENPQVYSQSFQLLAALIPFPSDRQTMNCVQGEYSTRHKAYSKQNSGPYSLVKHNFYLCPLSVRK